VAVSPAGRAESVREFGVFTADLYRIADWLKECGVKRVAMESTRVYWIPLFEVLEERGFEVRLVDARKVKNVSGRKSDLLDCQWLRQLHSYGLLAGAFRPAEEILPLRAYLRQRQMLVQYAAKHIQHMQKALQQMNLRLDNVVSDITGQTGMGIIKAILAGERDARRLVEENRHPGCRTSAAVMMQSLVGNYRAEHLFALQQAVELYEEYQTKIAACEAAIEEYLQELEPKTEEPLPELPTGAVTATAHKLAKLYYVLVKEGKEYEPEQAAQYEAKQQARAVAKLTKQAAALGYELRAAGAA
jgi:hypothetical protein